jgi:hypothetical protein
MSHSVGELRLRWEVESVRCLQLTDERHSPKDRFRGSQKVDDCVPFRNVAPYAYVNGPFAPRRPEDSCVKKMI